MSPKIVRLLGTCFLSLTIVLAGCGSTPDKPVVIQEQYPTKPITIIVPFTAGGGSDMLARAMERSATKYLGQPLVVVNKPGGAAMVGWNELASTKPDGYTIGITNVSLILQPLYGPTNYHYPTALDPIAQVASLPIIMAVKSEQSWQNIDDLIKYAKQSPGTIKYGHPGLGTAAHVAAEMFAKTAGITIEQVPFRGASEALTAFLGGHIQLLFVTPAEIKEYLKSGKVRVLAIAEEQRLNDPDLKHIPTFKEQGIDVIFSIWQGVGAPKNLPEDVKKKLAEGFSGIVNDPTFQKSVADLGLKVEYLGPQESAVKWVAENSRLTKIIKETGIGETIASQKN